jgi:NAD(P)-dependent dehydrogenase (short-subunit alcohol dehydrogenase family)
MDRGQDGQVATVTLKPFATLGLVRPCLPAMRHPGGWSRSMPTFVSRAAGLALTKALSNERAPDGILVNPVCIGLVKSGQWERRWRAAGGQGTLEAFNARLATERGGPSGASARRPSWPAWSPSSSPTRSAT